MIVGFCDTLFFLSEVDLGKYEPRGVGSSDDNPNDGKPEVKLLELSIK